MNSKRNPVFFLISSVVLLSFLIMPLSALAITLEETREFAENGNPSAQFRLGLHYERGQLGLAKDLVKAREWYEKAAAGKNIQAQNRLAVMYFNGLGGLDVDVQKAVDLFEKSAATGNDVGQFMLGMIYYMGSAGIEVDKVKAQELLRKSAEQGNPQAQDTMGVMYFNGEGGLEKDVKQAFDWYRKSADQGYVNAIIHLATMYYYGHGSTVDKEKAMALMSKAAQTGNETAVNVLTQWEEEKQAALEKPVKQHFKGKPSFYKKGGVVVGKEVQDEQSP